MDEVEGTVAPVVEEVSQNSEPVSDAEDSNSESDASDPWAEAKDAFDTADETEVVSDSHVEPEAPKVTKSEIDTALDGLAVPHKYKDKVKEFVESRLKSKASEFEKTSQELGTHKKANAELLAAWKDAAVDPSKWISLNADFGEKLGLPPDVVEQYRAIKYQGGQSVQPQQNNQPQGNAGSLDAVFNKYADKLATVEDAKSFVGILKDVIAESSVASRKESKQEMVELMKQLMGGYHDQAVKPVLAEYQKQKEAAEHSERKNVWRKATDLVRKKTASYGDFDKYESKITEVLSKDPAVILLNERPDIASQQGITHDSLIERAYYYVAHGDHVSASKSKPVTPGLRPTGKFVPTKKHQVDGWDAIKTEIYGDDD
jgi:hypothetical protein